MRKNFHSRSVLKKIPILIGLNLFVTQAHAGTNASSSSRQAGPSLELKEVLVYDHVDNIDIQLDGRSVLCTAADYSALMLKVNIPELRYLTSLNHTNIGTGLPCVQGGECTETNSPASVIELGPNISVPIHVQRVLQMAIDHDEKKCSQDLRETIEVDIKGKRFYHAVLGHIGNLPYEVCLQF